MKFAIVVGHTETAPGAGAKAPISQHEYAWNTRLCDMMIEAAKDFEGVSCCKFLRDGVGITGAYSEARSWGADAAMELHFNSAGPTATGTETLYVTDVSIPLADAVQDATVGILGLKDRGLKDAMSYNGGRGSRNLSQMGNRPSILTEPFFGSNPGDCAIADREMQALAEAQITAAVGSVLAIPPDDSWEVVASSLNVRGGPGVEFDTLNWGPLARGTEVTVLSRHGDWAQIAAPEGVAFVHGAFLA